MSNSLSTMSILALSVMGICATMKADEWDKKTNITINPAISKWKALFCPLVRMS